MKKFFVLWVMALLVSIPMSAQINETKPSSSFEPTETWPFLYEFFQQGMTRTRSGDVLSEARFNISLQDGSLYFIGKDDILMKPDMAAVYAARLGDDVFINVLGKMYRLLSELDLGCVLEGVAIDEDELGKVSIGYGITSSSASAQNVSLIMDGRFNLVNKSLAQIDGDKTKGAVLPLMKTIYLYINGSLIPASRQAVSDYPGVDKKEAATFFKQEKIKWKDPSSLEKVIIFVNSQISK